MGCQRRVPRSYRARSRRYRWVRNPRVFNFCYRARWSWAPPTAPRYLPHWKPRSCGHVSLRFVRWSVEFYSFTFADRRASLISITWHVYAMQLLAYLLIEGHRRLSRTFLGTFFRPQRMEKQALYGIDTVRERLARGPSTPNPPSSATRGVTTSRRPYYLNC